MAYQAQLTEAAEKFRAKMAGKSLNPLMQTDPEFVERFANFAFDEVVATVELDDKTRYLGWLATLLGCQGIDEYRVLLPAALRGPLSPIEVKEVVYQAVAYLGMGRIRPFLLATNEIMLEAGIELPLEPQATTEPNRESRLHAGEQAQIGCFGEQMAGYKDRGNPDYPHINTFLVDNCFGDWYTRTGLTYRERELMTFCFLAAQGGCESQIRGHAAGNKQVGNSKDFMVRVVTSNLPFIGYPRTLNALAALDEVYGTEQNS